MPPRRKYPWKKNVIEIKGHEPTEEAKLGTCTQCGKPAYTQWMSEYRKKQRVEVQLCEEHNAEFEKESREQRKRLGLDKEDIKVPDPMRKVTKAKSSSTPKFSHGRVNGSKTVWKLELACGHSVARCVEKEPKAARCNQCAEKKVR